MYPNFSFMIGTGLPQNAKSLNARSNLVGGLFNEYAHGQHPNKSAGPAIVCPADAMVEPRSEHAERFSEAGWNPNKP